MKNGDVNMGIYAALKNHITTKYPDVIAEYSEWIIANGNTTLTGKMRAYTHLLGMLLGGNSNKVKIKKGECEDVKRKEVCDIIKRLSEYDVVSFDVFDTLILRNTERPEDVFKVVGNMLGMEGFPTARKEVEQALYQQGNYNIRDIYSELERRKGISQEAFRKEFEAEKILCRDNPYIKEIYKAAMDAGKKVIAVSDMYWSKEYIRELLCGCGYSGIKEIYVSCDYGCTKREGTLFKTLKEENYREQKILHIGDNRNSDYVQARRQGIDAIQYVSVYERGKKYRYNRMNKQMLGQSIANAVINNEIHNGICSMDKYEQFGYIYGGPLVAGYCRYINRVAKDKKIDKLLFVARDADVICKAYQSCYAEYENEYVYASRNAVAQLAFERYPDYFIEQVLQLRFIDKAVNQSIESVLAQTGLLCLTDKLHEVDLKREMLFKQREMQQLTVLIYRYKGLITEAFASVREAAGSYWKQAIGNAKTIALVDIGWQASTMMCLNYFIKEICELPVELYTIHLGTIHSKWNDSMLENQSILSYCFDNGSNKQLGDFVMYHPVKKNVIEIMFTAPHATLVSYQTDKNGQGIPVFADVIHGNMEVNQKIQSGILNFVHTIRQIEKDLDFKILIQGSNVFDSLCEIGGQKKYIKYLFSDYRFSNVPCDAHEEKMGDIIKRNM